MKCCGGCFEDEHLKEYINGSGQPGDCEFCGAVNVATVDTTELLDLFEEIIALYEEVTPDTALGRDPWEVGKPLGYCIQEDWCLFSEDMWELGQKIIADMCRMTHAKHDLGIPKGQGQSLSVRYDESPWYKTPEHYWREFVEYVTRQRRYVLSITRGTAEESTGVWDPREWLPEKLALITTVIERGRPIWRARCHEERLSTPDPTEPPRDEWLGAPKPEIAVAGRANTAGIPVFYGSLDANTAAIEVRPALGQFVWVAQWETKETIRVVDLCDVPAIGSPFGLSDLRVMIERRDFLKQVSQALALPVAPHDKEVAYVPTQYVVEVIKGAGYDGMLHPSSQSSGGVNIVLFDHEGLVCVGPKILTRVVESLLQFSPSLSSNGLPS